jgi:hypothetical protein
MSDSRRARFEIVLEDRAEADDSPAVVRLRLLLKRLLRQGSFRCLSGRQLADSESQPPAIPDNPVGPESRDEG